VYDTLSKHRENIRKALQSNLAFSPRDFIRRPSSFIDADRMMFIEQITREMDQADELGLLYRNADQELAVFAERLPWDSAFFGYPIARLNGIFSLRAYNPYENYSQAVALLLKQAQERGIRYLFASVFPEDLATIRALGENRFQLIETRAVYHRTLNNFAYPDRFSVRLATPDDIPGLAQTAKSMINQYDRFHADPFIQPKDADRLMEKWIEASISEGFADATLVPDVANPKAFCTVKYHRDKWQQWGVRLAQPVFSAVDPEFKGWYLKIISELNYHLRDVGAEHCYLITQVTNRAVIRVWENLGFGYGRGEHIFRIVL
jgi:hypothetical protein